MIDVAIIGAGPAGAALAGLLAPRWRVTLVDARKDPAPRIGESLIPAARRLLRDMGLLRAVAARGYLAYRGNRSAWGGPAFAFTDFLRDPDGPGWHIDRVDFERMLRQTAVSRGATACFGPTLRALHRRGGQWAITLDSGEELTARIVVDATGRKAAVARQLGLVPERQGRIVALWLRGADASPRDAGLSTVAAVESGWLYTAVVLGGRVLALHTDADLVTPDLRARGGVERMARAHPAFGDSLRTADFQDAPEIVPAHGAILPQVAGDGWLAVGDAAMALDPLSSRGLFNALYSALAAATEVDARLTGAIGSFSDYHDHMQGIAAKYEQDALRMYRAETRWPDAPFWQRRHAGQERQAPVAANSDLA
ncbi:tryptophan 7-halogenase [Aestuariicoccus sp. MJ-SS9]|uniref:tryptophan 7-halogenase n=1 Tax=Aestuariicoccus sp. MJ-SS9 TaxID=3079855 RepID=UPI00290F014C|nr:tryptophan 7-halogenase [Aestuariicoccus sp. MJ-SS9]MDU8910759.1 tryptophan 7-halogenase [Aestuariicoccus sp. MJ-SS9]